MVLEQLLALDSQIFTAINSAHSPLFDLFFQNISHLGSFVIWIFIAAAIFFRKDKRFFFQLAAGMILAGVISIGLKLAIDRPRPSDSLQNVHLLDRKPDPSFPSNHAANAFLGARIFSKHYKKFTLIFYTLAILIAISRIYVGAHYPSDVIAGAALGFASSWFVSKYSIGEKLESMVGKLRKAI